MVVTGVERHTTPAHWRVFCDVDPQPGQSPEVYCHLFPIDTMAWRSAEYGIDASDSRTLLDVVLHEFHMTGHDGTGADHLYNCDEATARAAHLGRVDLVKKSVTFEDPHGMLGQIHLSHRVDHSDLAVKRAVVEHVRKHGVPPLPPRTEEPDCG